MKYFVFRNQTIELFFSGCDAAFSGYGDISSVPDNVECYIWFYQVPPGESSSVAIEVGAYMEQLLFVLERIKSDKQVLVLSLCSLFNINISKGNVALNRAIDDYNGKVIEISKTRSNIKYIDFSEFICQYSRELLVNWKYYFLSQTLLNPKLANDFKLWWRKKEDELAFKRKKCIVLDLDDTLWGGVLGEDGVSGIKIGGDYPGKAFTYWQRSLLALKETGVMLAVCSKNNEADVLEAWDLNPFMVLRKNDFVAWRINWQDKATNLRELSSELNIGLDSMVFIDDNPTERELVRRLLPMVVVPDFPSKPYDLMRFFDDLVSQYFSVYALTDEDVKKTELYRANAQRVAAQNQYSDLSDYLRSLDIKIDIYEMNKFNLPRIAQMSQKTNQFNLTTQRYTEQDLQQMSDNGCIIYAINVSDKFGDNGITGEIVLRPENETTISIDTFLLSCRILGKGIEFAFLDTVLNLLLSKGFRTIKACYRKTSKNSQVADFYERAGFSLVDSAEDIKYYSLTLLEKENKNNNDFYNISINF